MQWLVVLLIVLVLSASIGGFAFSRRQRRRPPIEPTTGGRPGGPRVVPGPAATSPVPSAPTTGVARPAGPTRPGERERDAPDALYPSGAVASSGPVSEVSVSPEMQAEIEEALRVALEGPAQEAETPAHDVATPSEAGAPEAPPSSRARLRDRLSKARGLFSGYMGSVRARRVIDGETWDDLEEALIRADVGVATTQLLLDDLRVRVKADGIKDPDVLVEALKSDLKARLRTGDRDLHFEPGIPNVWLFVGVNGVGKTTTVGKIGQRETAAGRSVIMAAGDTFRAAAAEQLGLWAERTNADLVRGHEGGDPGSVIFDAVERAAARGIDLVLADTAGRLHTKANLMEELRKIRRIADKPPGKVTEVLLVLDATTGQNGLVQAQYFKDAADLTGVVLTKLDGTAKGGIALAIQQEFGIPIKMVGVGEGADDLVPFDPDEFVDALFAE